MKKIEINKLEIAANNFLNTYFEPEVSRHCLDVIMHAELSGKSTQGFLKLMGTVPLQSIKAINELKITHRSKLSASIEGNKNPSFHIAQTATQIAIDKVKDHGFGIVGANGIFSSTGAIGYYSEQIAKAGYIGFCCARSPGTVAPFGIPIPLFGTNPLSWAFPTNNDPIVFDMATSAITFYELVLAKMRGEKIPEGLAIDNIGDMTTDPQEAMVGGVLPFDKGYKGSSLSMMVEILSGPLVNASSCDYETFDKDWGFLVLAIDPEILVNKKEFLNNTSELVNIIRDKGGRLPNDNSKANKARLLSDGYINIEDEVATLLDI